MSNLLSTKFRLPVKKILVPQRLLKSNASPPLRMGFARRVSKPAPIFSDCAIVHLDYVAEIRGGKLFNNINAGIQFKF